MNTATGKCYFIADFKPSGVCLYTSSLYFVIENKNNTAIEYVTDDEDKSIGYTRCKEGVLLTYERDCWGLCEDLIRKDYKDIYDGPFRIDYLHKPSTYNAKNAAIDDLVTSIIPQIPCHLIAEYLYDPTYPCDDCGRYRFKEDLTKAHACDDWDGCCYKYVCWDYCLYECCNGHLNADTCSFYFCDPPPDDRYDDYPVNMRLDHDQYTWHQVPCQICNSRVIVRRNFTFDNYGYVRSW